MDNRNFQFMFYGFAVAWTLIVIYVLTLAAREKRLKSELDRLKRMIEDKSAK